MVWDVNYRRGRAVPQGTIPASPMTFLERQHRIYTRMTRVVNSLRLRIRASGWMALGFSGVFLFLGADPGRSETYRLFSLVMGLLGVAVVCHFRRKVRAEAVRRVGGAVVPGQQVTVRVRVRNAGRWKWRAVRLVEVPPLPVPGVGEYAGNVEPGESRRNAFDRFFKYYRFAWLGERRRVFDVAESALFDLDAGEETEVEIPVLARRRGMMEFRDLRLARSDVFGFFRRFHRIPTKPGRAVVVPRPQVVPDLRIAGRGKFRPEVAGASTARRGQGDEFLGLRDYVAGDSLHHIHWASSARRGSFVVREFEEIFRPRAALVIDLRLAPGGRAREATRAFERAMGCAAWIAGRNDRRNDRLDVLLVQERAHCYEAGPGGLHLSRLMEVLASLQPAPADDAIDRLQSVTMSRARDCESVVFLCLDWDESRAAFVRRIRAQGPEMDVVCVPPDGQEPTLEPAADVHLVEGGEDGITGEEGAA